MSSDVAVSADTPDIEVPGDSCGPGVDGVRGHRDRAGAASGVIALLAVGMGRRCTEEHMREVLQWSRKGAVRSGGRDPAHAE